MVLCKADSVSVRKGVLKKEVGTRKGNKGGTSYLKDSKCTLRNFRNASAL